LADKTKKIGHAAAQWHVRDENGAVFGPVDFKALKSWVEDGRVSPASELSADGGRWVPAVQIRELEMNCVAEIEPGSFYGPIHRAAMRGLIAAGSISADAPIYGKDGGGPAAEPTPAEGGVRQAEYDAVVEQLAGLEVQCGGAESRLQSALQEMAELTARYQSEKKAGRELAGTVAALRQEAETLRAQGCDGRALMEALRTQSEDYEASVNALQSRCAEQQGLISGFQRESAAQQGLVSGLRREGAAQSALISTLRGELDGTRSELDGARAELAACQSAADKAVLKYQVEMAALHEVNAGLKSQAELLRTEREDLAAETDALRSHNRDQIKLREERERLARAELTERESAARLAIDNLRAEHESAISRMKQQSVKEEARHVEEAQTRNQQIAGLLVRLEELELTNRELKEDFARCADRQSCRGADTAERRKLMVVKRLLAEAAALLEGVESPPEEEPEGVPGAALPELDAVELLEYEEVLAEEFAAKRGAPAAAAEPVRESTGGSGPVKGAKTAKPKGEKKWPFGGAKPNLGRDSLAELEAQAQMELQRLSASQELSAIFERKK